MESNQIWLYSIVLKPNRTLTQLQNKLFKLIELKLFINLTVISIMSYV